MTQDFLHNFCMASAQTAHPGLTGLDADAPRAMILAQHQLLAARDTQIEQLKLRLEDLETRRAENAPLIEKTFQKTAEETSEPAGRPLPEYLPRETRTITPKQEACPGCGGKLKYLGEDVCEILEYVPASFKVIRQVRTMLCCTGCDRIVEEPAPSRPIDRSLAGPALLAHVLVSKNADHLPLYRQAEIYERLGQEDDGEERLRGFLGSSRNGPWMGTGQDSGDRRESRRSCWAEAASDGDCALKGARNGVKVDPTDPSWRRRGEFVPGRQCSNDQNHRRELQSAQGSDDSSRGANLPGSSKGVFAER